MDEPPRRERQTDGNFFGALETNLGDRKSVTQLVLDSLFSPHSFSRHGNAFERLVDQQAWEESRGTGISRG